MKFSRHLVVNFPGKCVFQSTALACQFVESLCNHIRATASFQKSDESILSADAILMRQLFFRKEVDGKILPQELFVDLSVYRNNNKFRLPLSAKFAEIGMRYLHIWLPQKHVIMNEAFFSVDIFKASLVSYPAV